jgi:adenylate cyclase
MTSEEKLKALLDALDLKQKELDLVMAIDEIRDTVPEPPAMLKEIVDLLADWLEADLCLIFLLDRETGEAELKAVSDRGQGFGPLQQVIPCELAEQGIRLDQITIWEGHEVLPAESLETVPGGLQLAAVPIIMGTEERVGALLLARSQVPFGPNDVQLLRTAEDQIDSAVIQGYLYDKHQQAIREASLKGKELDLIMAIDEIRDSMPEQAAMLAAIVKLLADRLEADLCLLFLLDQETGEAKLKAVNDRSQEFQQLEQVIAHELAEPAVRLDYITTWEGREQLPMESLANVPGDPQLVAVPIIMGAEERLGALVLARSQVPFGPDDVQLLKTAEDQIDSAVIQGQIYDKHQLSAKELSLRQKELDLIMAIDEIRDTAPEPSAMLKEIVNLLADRLEADLTLLFLLDRQTGEVELKAVNDRSQQFGQLEQIVTCELAGLATRLDRITTWEGREQLPMESVANVPEDLQLAAVPIIMGAEERLGALLLARFQVPFGPDDVQLLKTAEDQIDSTVIQGQVYRKHQLSAKELSVKQKELDLIMIIDEIRDSVPEPRAMLKEIVDLLADRLKADLCLLFLLDHETREAKLKAVSDRSQQFDQLQQVITRELAEMAIRLDRITTWEGHKVLPAVSLAKVSENLQLVAIPIIMGEEERLGALLLARSHVPFGPDDVQLLRTAEDQIDSAVIQGQVYHKHQLSAKELETIYQVDRIRDQGLHLDDMLNAVLKKLCAAIETEMGFFMHYDQTERQLEMQAATHQDLFRGSPCYEVIEQVTNESLQRAELICRNNLGEVLDSVMCLPLILNENIIGVLGVVNCYGRRGFTAADRRLLRAVGSQIDTAIYEGIEKHQLRVVLRRSVGPQVMEQLLANPNVDILKGERKVLTVLYADLRGSTDLAERTKAELLVEFINDYLSQMTDVILEHEGTLDKFVGDEVMALFGAPIPQKDHALRAVRAGLAMQATYQTVTEHWREYEVEAPLMGIGIATGRMTVGEMGGSQRADYTIIGRAANLGARICDAAKGGQVLISQKTYDLVKEAVEVIPLPGQHFRGVARDVTVYHVTRVVDG